MKLIKLPPLSNTPLVSIIVPSYNQGAFIQQTLDSIIKQDYRPIEILVIDGASKDETVNILKSYDGVSELHWWSEPDSGPVEAVNKGFAKAKGEICSIQSSDDFYLPGAIERVVAVLCSDENLGLVYGDYIKVDTEGKELNRYQLQPFSLPGLLARDTHIPQPTAFFRLDIVKQIGAWDDRIPYVPDTDLWFRIAFHSRVEKIDTFLACSREHSDQRNVQKEYIYRDYKLMLGQSADLSHAPRRLRMAASAGLYLLGVRYNIHKSDCGLTKALWKAVISYPTCIFSPTLPKHRLIPGYFKIAHVFGKIRRLFKVRNDNK